MRCRFVKRFTISIILLSFGGIWLMSRFTDEHFMNSDFGLLPGKHDKRFNSRRFFEDLIGLSDNVDEEEDEKSNATFLENQWILDILHKNLSKDKTIDRLLQEIDKHVPKKYTEEELIEQSLTAKIHSYLTGGSSYVISEPIEVPTESVKPITPIYRNRTKRKPPNRLFPGFMNVHIWEAWCGRTVEDLRRNKHFPLYPDARTVTYDLFVKQRGLNYGQRIFGYLHPPETGFFTFCLSSDDNSELWLSNSSNPSGLKKLAWVGNLTNPLNTPLAEFTRFQGQISSPVYLSKDKHYFLEVLHKQAGFAEHVLVAWKGPGIPRTKLIVEDYISAYIDEDELGEDVNLLAEYVPETIASFPTHVHGSFEANYLHQQNISRFGVNDRRDHFHLTPSINASELQGLLPRCSYKPSYLVDFEVNRYEGVYLIHDTAVYPNDQTELTHMIPSTDCDNRAVDSHLNLVRPTTSSPEDEENPSEAEIADKSYVALSPKFAHILAKLRNRFKNFRNSMHDYNRAVGHRKAVGNRVYMRGLHNRNRPSWKHRKIGKKVVVHKSTIGAGVSNYSNENNLDIQEKSIYNNDIKNNNLKSKNRNSKHKKHTKHSRSKRKTTKKRRARKEKLNSYIKQHPSANEIVFLPNVGENSLQEDPGLLKIAPVDNPLLRHETELTGRKLLAVSSDDDSKPAKEYDNNNNDNGLKSPVPTSRTRNAGKRHSVAQKFTVDVKKHRLKYAYETDDEGLPASWNNNKRARPIFVPIAGVENIEKPLPKVPISTRIATTQPETDDDDDGFQMKSAYKKLNIRSNKDVLKFFKIYRYAFYDMIQDIPRIHTWKFKFSLSQCRSDGNLLLNSKVAESVVNKYMNALKAKYADKYTLKKIVNVEENHDVINGDRYLIELDLKVKGQGEKSFRLSQYVYQKLGSLELCEPTGFQWNPHAAVHVIVPVKNQGRWVQHFIDNMEKIYLETLDPHLNVIIVDFNSTDIDIEASLRKSKLKRYQLIRMDGLFQRALGVQAGADAVKNPHDIIFTCDLHLEIPSSLIYSIRKHCVERKMAFAPIVVRLDCGYKPENPYGLWEIQGYGLFAICKSDFDKAGGMNTKEFKTKWGGEDWEMLDRILTSGIEVERLRIPKFYHYFHSKKRMWNHQNTEE